MGVHELKFEIDLHWKLTLDRCPWISFVPLYARDSEGNLFVQPRGRKIIYQVEQGRLGEDYICYQCGRRVESELLGHLVWNIPFLGIHTNKCLFEPVPFCPNCERPPENYGRPITTNLLD